MDTLALVHLGHETIHYEDIAGKGAKQLTFDQIALEQAGPYAAEDADITLRLHHKLYAELSESEDLLSVYRDIEMPMISVLSRTERRGVFIDTEALSKQSTEHAHTLKQLEQDVFDLAGEEFNLSSTKQLSTILFDKLGLPIIKKTPKGAPSTSEEVLQELATEYPLPALIMRYRGITKLKSTYTDKLPQQIQVETGRLHTSYHQAVTSTGRLSSSDPNLQNIPIKTVEGRRIRHAFKSSEGYSIVAADYSQVELRIMAHLSQEKYLMYL